MKKKKFKKKIKKLEKRVKRYCSDLSGEVLEVDTYLMDKIKDFNEQINELKSKISWHDNRLSALDGISRVDYTMYSTKEEKEKTCDTCKWKPLMEQGSQDMPCYGCTADDKKMWKSKEN